MTANPGGGDYRPDTPVSVAVSPPDARETDGGGMDNQGAQIEAWRTRALTAEADAIRLAGLVAELRARLADRDTLRNKLDRRA